FRVDTTTRIHLLRALAAVVDPGSVMRLRPALLAALRAEDSGVRAAGIELWVACVEAAGPLPDEFAEMAETLLGDPYVVVHTAMLRAIPWLGLPDEVVDRLLHTVELWAHAYADRSGWVMDAAVSA